MQLYDALLDGAGRDQAVQGSGGVAEVLSFRGVAFSAGAAAAFVPLTSV
jgi:hypothetical protein